MVSWCGEGLQEVDWVRLIDVLKPIGVVGLDELKDYRDGMGLLI